MNETARKWIYVGQTVLGAVLIVLSAFQVISEDTRASVEAAIGGVVMLMTGELARRHITPAPKISADDARAITDALAQATTAGAQVVEHSRAELERQLSWR